MYSKQFIMPSLTLIWDIHVKFGEKFMKNIWYDLTCSKQSFKNYKFWKTYELFEPLYNQLKINSLRNNVILNNCLFVFDNLVNNIPDVSDQFFKPFKELHKHHTRGSQGRVA